jgi:hypothetical protein
MADFKPGCVITCPDKGRDENTLRTAELATKTIALQTVVYIDGAHPSNQFMYDLDQFGVDVYHDSKYEPSTGMIQPRNRGVEYLDPEINQVWFLDSDLVWEEDPLEVFRDAWDHRDRIMIGPYDWMAPGETKPWGRLELSDGRWASFNEFNQREELVRDLGAGLACFGGNLLWPRRAFEEIGGFSPDLFHGRCEDGELGLRAVEAGIPMSLVQDARAWHVSHPKNMEWILAANRRDVPLLDAWHPWVHLQGVHPVEEDGCRFNFTCQICGVDLNTWYLWSHMEEHRVP